MVVFTCSHCGESVNKPKVEKHYLTKCRGRTPNLSCMDCFKDFVGNDFEGHTKCVSEEQRYSAKGFVAKVKKGEEKQDMWVSMVQSVLEEQKNAPKNVIRIIEEICKHSNTPRKKPKFINFVKNVCGHRTMPEEIEAAWDLISVKLNDLRSVNQNNQNNGKPKENGQTSEETKVSSDVSDTKDVSIVEYGTDKLQDSIKNSAKNSEPLTKKQRKEEKKMRKYEAALQAAAVNPEQEVKYEAALQAAAVQPEKEVEVSIENTTENAEPLTKKQRKEEKKRRKYEAALQAAAVRPEEVEVKSKKNRKKSKQEVSDVTENAEAEELIQNCKNTEEADQEAIENVNGSKQKKNKKRKHTEVNGEDADPTETPEVEKPKKQKVSETEEINFHEQNVASSESRDKTVNFDWHATIISLLQKKGNEMPFKRLQKKILAEYSEATGKTADDRIAEKLCKKLKGAPNVKVDKNRVLLVN